jgi:hypothetical protein
MEAKNTTHQPPEWFVARRPPRREPRKTSAQQCEGEVGQGNGVVVHDGWLSSINTKSGNLPHGFVAGETALFKERIDIPPRTHAFI